MASFTGAVRFEKNEKRLATSLELYFTQSHENDNDITCYTITMAAKTPLLYEQVNEALLHLYRKIPSLRVRMWRDEAEQLWSGPMEEEKVLLRFLDDSHDPEKVHIEETRKQHTIETGPMWRVTVLPARGEVDAEAAAAGFGHQYYVMFGFHHAITDGHSTMRICGHFLSLLNAIIEGKQIDDQEQLAEFVDDRFHKRLVAQAIKRLDEEKGLREQFNKKIAELDKIEPILFKAYPPTNNPQPKTESIWRELDFSKTQVFLKRAKMEKMSIHSAFTSVIHGAMVDLMLDAGFVQDTYQIVSIHDLNERRYWEHDGEKAFGTHIVGHNTSVPVPCDILNNFWENARAFHSQFQAEIQNQYSIVMAGIQSETYKPVEKSEDFYKNRPPCKIYYYTSNMGDITRIFKRNDGSDYEHVRAVRLRRTTSIHSYVGPCGFCVQTLNGKLLCSLDYNTRIMSHALAEKLINKVFELLETLSQ